MTRLHYLCVRTAIAVPLSGVAGNSAARDGFSPPQFRDPLRYTLRARRLNLKHGRGYRSAPRQRDDAYSAAPGASCLAEIGQCCRESGLPIPLNAKAEHTRLLTLENPPSRRWENNYGKLIRGYSCNVPGNYTSGASEIKASWDSNDNLQV